MPALLNMPVCSARSIVAGQSIRRAAPVHSSCSSGSAPAAPRHVTRAAAEDKGKSVDELLAEANALLEQVAHGEYEGLQASIGELEELGYVCDESGCVLMLPEKRSKRKSDNLDKKLLQGNSWNIGHPKEPASPEYPAVVSGPFWSIPMQEKELQEFLQLLEQLRRVVQQLDAAGQWLPGSSQRPASRIKWDSPTMSLQAIYSPAKPYFSMDMTFTTSGKRPITASWPATILSEVVAVLDKETDVKSPAAPAPKPAAVSA